MNERSGGEDEMKHHRISKSAMAEAQNICQDWAQSGASNRYKVDEANVLLTALALTAESMSVAPASLAERRAAAVEGSVSVFTEDWDRLVVGRRLRTSRFSVASCRRSLSSVPTCGSIGFALRISGTSSAPADHRIARGPALERAPVLFAFIG